MRTVVRSAVLIAFSVACGYAKLILFPYLFFVELFTMAVFLSGTLMGVVGGAWVGVASRLIFSVANPLGPPHPWILAAQVVGGAFVGALGGASARWLLPGPGLSPVAGWRRGLLLLGCGLVASLVYDALTNLAQGLVFGSIPAALALGAIPAMQHLGSNLALFLIVGNLAFPWLERHPAVTSRAG
jgi:hypothetical protein